MFKGRDLHLAQGLYGGSVVLGSGFVLFAVPQLLDAFGWRGAFLGCALAGSRRVGVVDVGRACPATNYARRRKPG